MRIIVRGRSIRLLSLLYVWRPVDPYELAIFTGMGTYNSVSRIEQLWELVAYSHSDIESVKQAVSAALSVCSRIDDDGLHLR